MCGIKKAISAVLLFRFWSLVLTLTIGVIWFTHNATEPWSDITGGNLSHYLQLPLEPFKALYYFFWLWKQACFFDLYSHFNVNIRCCNPLSVYIGVGFIPVNECGYSLESCFAVFRLLLVSVLSGSSSLVLQTATISPTWTAWLSAGETQNHKSFTQLYYTITNA